MGNKKKKTRGRQGGLQVVTLCISTSMVLILLGMVVLTVFTARNLSAFVKEKLTVTMMLSEDITENEAQQLCAKLAKRPYISNLEYISKEQVLEEQKESMGTDPSEFAGTNPFLSEVDFQLVAEYANNDSLRWISSELKQLPKVAEITYPQDLINSVNKTLSKVSIILLILAALLLFVSFALINNTVRLGIYARRFSIHTMKLVGASWAFIRRPFLNKAVMLGLIAGIIANVILGIGVYMLFNFEPDVKEVITPQVLIVTAISVLLFGVVITMLCSWFSVNKFLRMKAGELYKI